MVNTNGQTVKPTLYKVADVYARLHSEPAELAASLRHALAVSIKEAQANGSSLATIARELGISRGRVHQLGQGE